MAFIMSSPLHKIINGRDLLSWKVAFETFTEEKHFWMSLVGYYDQIMVLSLMGLWSYYTYTEKEN